MAKPRIAVLMYHAIQEQPSPISITPELFQWQMGWLHEQSIQVVSLDWLVKCMLGGLKPARHTVVITFDDGFSNLERFALPVLQRYKFPATIYLVTGYCGKTNDWPGQPDDIPRLPLLTWDQIRRLANEDVEFGVHTVNHPVLDSMNFLDAMWEIRFAKKTMNEQLGRPIRSFAYPYGRYNRRIKQLISEEFMSACSTDLGFIKTRFDPHAIERIDINYFLEPAAFRRLFSPVTPSYLRLRKMMRSAASFVLARPWR